MTRLIGLYSSTPGCGKTTVAVMLTDQGWTIAPFAAPLKRMASSLLADAGYSRSEVAVILSKEKARPLSLIPGKPTGRYLLQTLGTAWGRELIHQNLWIKLWEDTVKRCLNGGESVVCDDVRTEAEAEAIRAMGGELWRIVRPGATVETAALGHPTEGALEHLGFDRTLANAGGLAALKAAVEEGVAR